jgi:hypothetical protein
MRGGGVQAWIGLALIVAGVLLVPVLILLSFATR